MKGIILICFLACLAVAQVTPTWSTDSTFKAGSSTLLSTLTNAVYDNTFTITFASATTTNPPIFVYGVKSYEGRSVDIQELISWCRSTSS